MKQVLKPLSIFLDCEQSLSFPNFCRANEEAATREKEGKSVNVDAFLICIILSALFCSRDLRKKGGLLAVYDILKLAPLGHFIAETVKKKKKGSH